MAFPPCTAPPGSGGLPFSALSPLPWKGLLMEMLDWVKAVTSRDPRGTAGALPTRETAVPEACRVTMLLEPAGHPLGTLHQGLVGATCSVQCPGPGDTGGLWTHT